ncbi:MAG: AAA family ATPase [Symploca sp. SIO2E6]|nr:AAA family ATPase [Symploca sp. SIO2E6]
MVALDGYEDFRQIHDGANSQVYRAQRVADGQPVILKFLNRDYPTSEQIRRYKQEYHLTYQLVSPGIIKAYSLEEWQRSYAIVLEDFGGISLKQWLKQHQQVSLEEFLLLAIAITDSLGQIHAENIIHKDLNPDNIVFNPETQEVKIIDFGISTQLSRENPTLKNPHILEGTLAYISPEQTGRMNRSLDYRTDFYSLGVSFYEMLTGKLPFKSSDPLELVHCHLAQHPPTPQTPHPRLLVDLVAKLMAKNAEDRYQSAYGLKADLEDCRRQLEATGKIIPFLLGKQDISPRLQIPQKLYGREREIATLLAAFERVADPPESLLNQGGHKGVELMLVAGYSGIGKSSLVQELYKPITARRGYFISGKFDQFQRNVPYSAIVAAFRGLMGQLLGETEAQLQVWREKLLQALGTNGQVIIDVIPEVELIIGKQPPVPLLGANEAENRFNLVFGNFIRAFCDCEHPLTLFLDDLQWADLATLKLVERMLVEGQTKYLLLLGAYRDNEVAFGHPLAITLEKLQQNDQAIAQITLNPLPLDNITCLISETLKHTPQTVQDLAQLVWQKTGGNPFFVNEFLQALYNEKLLQFHGQSRRWQWDIAVIQATEFTDNVVELMVGKLQKLPPSSQDILSLAACWGAEFDLKLLTCVEQKSPEEIFQLLKIALEGGLILPLSELDENLLIQSYKFGHDRIQQAAYSLIPEDQRASKHLQIGRILLKQIPAAEREDQLFDLVDQLNRGIELVEDADEREKLASLNLKAGCKAINATAYAAAITYLNLGISLLDAQSWQNQYQLTLSLYQEAAKAAYLNAEIERMEQLAATMAREAQTPLDLLELGKIKLDAYTNQGRLDEALATGLESLASLGIEFPQAASRADFAPAFANIQVLLSHRQPAELANLPQMEDSLIREALALLVKISPVTYLAVPALFPLVIFKQVELSITYGNAPASAFSYATYGTILCGVMGELALGYEYGQLALKVFEQFNGRQFQAGIFMMVYSFINHWRIHLREAIKPLQQAFFAGLEQGDFAYAGYVNNSYYFRLYLTGKELTEIEGKIEPYNQMLEAIGQQTALSYNQPFRQAVLNLQGESDQPHQLVGKVMDEKSLLSYYQNSKNRTGLWLVYIAKATLCYLFAEFEQALIASTSAQEYLTAATSHVLIPVWYFYNSLVRLALVEDSREEQENLSVAHSLNQVRANQEKMERWAESAPMNYLHKFYLVEAEYHRVLGEKAKAIEFYSLAIAKAQENEYIQEEALANELAAKFYLHWGQEKLARVYLMDAHYCYTRWGATAKVKHLEDNYPQLCQSSTIKSADSTRFNTHTTNESTDSAALDLVTVIKSTNAISSEIVLDKLLAALMNILVENAGAQRGILILTSGDGLLVEATKEAESEEVSVLQSLPLDECERLSSKIVHYVARTRETVVLNDATREGKFTDDAYIQQYHCQSIACTPLINQGKFQGIIYLENNLTTGAFTQERLTLLRALATQAAISLENAQLYNNITTLNAAYERFVPNQFLSFLEKQSIVDVELGDQVEQEMTVLFSDIRDFTTISEQMTPGENFAFINEYLSYMEPQIQKYGGFIDKYIGDAIMALFPNSADDAVQGSLAMLEELKKYNSYRQTRNLQPLRIGIGLHTGLLMLGTVGGFGRMDGTAIGDSVNLSSRVEGLTKTYGVSLLITHKTLARLNNPLEYDLRFIEQVKAKGKAKAVGLFEVFTADPPALRSAKITTKSKFERAVMSYYGRSFQEAAGLFQECCDRYPDDRTAGIYLERSKFELLYKKYS